MIRTNEAVLLLKTSSPTFYKRVKKTGIQLISKKDENGKASYINDSDLDRLALEMGKALPSQNNSQESQNKQHNEQQKVIKDDALLREKFQLEIQNKTLEGKIEEYSGYVEIYKKQLDDNSKKLVGLENDKMSLLTEVLKAKVSLWTYKVMFYSLAIVVVVSILLFASGILKTT